MTATNLLVLGLGLIVTACASGPEAQNTDKPQPRVDGPAKRATESGSSRWDGHGPIVDHDYRFKLALPGRGWKLFGHAEIAKMVPDAIAGAASQSGVFCAVAVEHMGSEDLELLLELMNRRVVEAGQRIHSQKKTTFKGREAYRTDFSGTVNGISMEFVRTSFAHQGHSYQLVAWGMQGALDERAVQQFLGAFEILPGEVVGRDIAAVTKDVTGIGWRVKDGVFESATAGVRVRPPKGWRLVVGGELGEMNSDALVGMARSAPEAYAVLIAEPLHDVDPSVQAASFMADFARDKQQAGEPVAIRTGLRSEPVRLHRYRTSSPALEFWYSAVPINGRAYQLLAWSLSRASSRVGGGIKAALSTIELLPAQQQAKLARELAAGPDRQNLVLASESLRRGTYRNFDLGLRWQAPAGFWRIEIGNAARQRNADALLFATEEWTGVNTMLIAEKVEADLASYHQTVASMLKANSGFVQTDGGTVVLGGAPGRYVQGHLAPTNGPKTDYRITTTVKGGVGVQVATFGLAGVAKRHPKRMEETATGLSFDSGPPVTRQGRRYRDLRLGYELTLPGDDPWAFRDATPSSWAGAGSNVLWEGPRGAIGVMALCFLREGQDDVWPLDLMEKRLRAALNARLSAKSTRSETTFAGLPARRLSFRGGSFETDALLVFRDRTVFAITVARTGTGPLLEEVMRDFRFLD